MSLSKILLIALLFVSIDSFAQSTCNGLQIENLPSSYTLDSNTAPSLTFRVRRSNSAPSGTCNYFVVVDYGGASNYDDRELERSNSPDYPFHIYKEVTRSNELRNFQQATSTGHIISGALTGNTKEVNVSYFPYLDANLNYRAGTYQNNFDFSLYAGTISNKNSANHADTDEITFRYTKPEIVDLSLVPTGGAFVAGKTTETLNFGALTTNETLGFDILLKYNNGYRLEMRSLNDGRIKHSGANTYIGYQMRVNGVNNGNYFTLDDDWDTISDSDNGGCFFCDNDNEDYISPSTGHRFNVTVRIGTVAANQRAGTYNDTVSIRVSSND